MALKKFNPSLKQLDRLCTLVYGANATGKTHLQGDFLRWAVEQGKVVRFINFAGQDGHSSIADMGLGPEVGLTVETLADFAEACDLCRKEKVEYAAIDGLHDVYKFVLIKELGSLRYPDPKKDGERAKMLWGQIGWSIEEEVMRAKNAIPFVLWSCTVDKNEDVVAGGGANVSPDLFGKVSFKSVGWFDMVGLLTAATIGPGNVQRKIQFQASPAVKTRQRLPREITQDIVIPKDKGGWEAILKEIKKCMGVA